MSTNEMTLTGCVDCGIVKVLPKEEPVESTAVYLYGGAAVRMWKDLDGKHTLILVKAKPERMFLSCQETSKILSEEGVAAILNFIEKIRSDQEVHSYVTES